MSLLTLTSALAFASPQLATAQQSRVADVLEGTWTVQVTPRNCVTHAQLGAPFLSLLTFNDGGTMTETTANPRFFPAQRGPGHGVWSSLGNHAYRASSIALITANGVLTALQTIAQRIEISSSRDSFVTPEARVVFMKPDGTPTGRGCATAFGKRFEQS